MERKWPEGTVLEEDGKRRLPLDFPEEDDPDDDEVNPRERLHPQERCLQEEAISGAPLRNTRKLLYFFLPNMEDRFLCYTIDDILNIMRIERRVWETQQRNENDIMYFRFPHNNMRVRMTDMERAIETRRNTFRLVPDRGDVYIIEAIMRPEFPPRREREKQSDYRRRINRYNFWEGDENDAVRRERIREYFDRFAFAHLEGRLADIFIMIVERMGVIDPIITLEDMEDLDVFVRLLERIRAVEDNRARHFLERKINELPQNLRGIRNALDNIDMFVDLLRRVERIQNNQRRIEFERILHHVNPDWMDVAERVREEDVPQNAHLPLARIPLLPEDFVAVRLPDNLELFNPTMFDPIRISQIRNYIRDIPIRYGLEDFERAFRMQPRDIEAQIQLINEFIANPTLIRWRNIQYFITILHYTAQEGNILNRARDNLPDIFLQQINRIRNRGEVEINIENDRTIALMELEYLLLPNNLPRVQQRINYLNLYIDKVRVLNQQRFNNDERINVVLQRIITLKEQFPSALNAIERYLGRLMGTMYGRIRRNAPNHVVMNEQRKNELTETIRGLQNNTYGMINIELVIIEDLNTDDLLIQEDLDRIQEIVGNDHGEFERLRERVREALRLVQENGLVDNNLIVEGERLIEDIGEFAEIDIGEQQDRVNEFEENVENALNPERRLRQLEARAENDPVVAELLAQDENVLQRRIDELGRDDGQQGQVPVVRHDNVQERVIAINNEYVQAIQNVLDRYERFLTHGNVDLIILLTRAPVDDWGDIVGRIGEDAGNQTTIAENEIEEITQQTLRRLEALRNQNNELVANAIAGTRETVEMRLAEVADLHNEWMDTYTVSEALLRHQLAVRGNLDDANFQDEQFENNLRRQMLERRRPQREEE